MNRLISLLIFFAICNCSLKSQSIRLCDSLTIFYNLEHASDRNRFIRILEYSNDFKLNKYVLKKQCGLTPNSTLIRNLFFSKSFLKSNKQKRSLTLLEIKLQPTLNESLQKYNNEVFLAALNPVDIRFGRNSYLKLIKKNFGLITYFKVLRILNKPLSRTQYLEVKQKFQEEVPPNRAVWTTEKWFAALLMVKMDENDAREYIVNVARETTKPAKNREMIHEIIDDLVATKDRHILNFIVDEFLMSDYGWSDYDHGYSDFWLAYRALLGVVNDPFIEDSLLKYPDDKTFRAALRQWFKDHRETYKIKP